MREFFLGLIIICSVIIGLTKGMEVDTMLLTSITTLMVVVITSFSISALLQNIKSLSLSKNYGISGVIGVVVGVSYYSWVGQHLESLQLWLENYGLFVLLVLILISALVLYFFGPGKKKEIKESTDVEIPKPPVQTDAASDMEPRI